MSRYREIFRRIYEEERKLTLRRTGWGFALGLLSDAAFYGAYAWIAIETVRGAITLGEMTMYLTLFRQGQSAVAAMLSAIGGMYEDNLYLSNLYDYLEQPPLVLGGAAASGPDPAAGIEFEHVRFTYPGAETPAIQDLTLKIAPGRSVALVGLNGSGKTTLVKLLAGLYAPDEEPSASGPRLARLGPGRVAREDRRDLSGLQSVPAHGRREHRRGRRARVRGPRAGATRPLRGKRASSSRGCRPRTTRS
jgi:ABC-type uncharacterized transport system fused permease/ATPase subunit